MFRKLAEVIVIALIIALSAVSGSFARTASLHHPDGAKVNIQCDKTACYVQHVNASGNPGNVEPAGPATNVNFVRILKIWQSRGYR